MGTLRLPIVRGESTTALVLLTPWLRMAIIDIGLRAALEEVVMFRVENADFIADKLAAELLPDQEFREVMKNAQEAIERRMRADGSVAGGRIEFDVDWVLLRGTGHWYISCADNGDAMNRSELERYTTTLAVQGAGRNQHLRGN